MTSRKSSVSSWRATLPLTIVLVLTACSGGGGGSSTSGGGGGGNTPPPSTANEWTWMSGSNLTGAASVYGTQGVASASNTPGARAGALTWTDSSGNLWLFSGLTGTSTGGTNLSDLWEFSPTTKEWTWVSGSSTANQPAVYGTLGVASPSNFPGARIGAFGWTDSSGNIWLYGGGAAWAASPGLLNDLWEFSPATKQWTWVTGSSTANQSAAYGTVGVTSASNTPGARSVGFSWTDKNGNFWLFGGGNDSGEFTDFWEFNTTTKEWTWVGGSSGLNQPVAYGTLGVASASNTPGARGAYVGWADGNGNFWLYGGLGYHSGSDLGDLWEFNTTSKQWTWVGGTSALNQPAVFGTQGVASASNTPGGRDTAVGWTDSSGNLWLFGGYGDGATAWSGGVTWGDLNDLWEFNTTTKEWTWMSGSSTANQPGVYGTLGVASASYAPAARDSAVTWADSSGNFWLFGGEDTGFYNDLWHYQP